MEQIRADVLVVGGGLGGVAAALAAAEHGATVVLSEATDWLGGQMTSQAVPPDEHPWIESFGCTASYRRLRDGIRDHYRRWYPLTERARSLRVLNPGAGLVSTLCVEPRAAVSVLEAMLAPHRGAGRLRVLMGHEPVAAPTDGDRVEGVTLRDRRDGGERHVEAAFVLDATETGELLPLAGCEFVEGFESARETGEPHAPDEAQPRNHQAVTWCFVLSHHGGQDWTVDRPEGYARWRDEVLPGWPGPRFAFAAPDPKTGGTRRHTFTPNPPGDPAALAVDLTAEGGADELWTFRRIAARGLFRPGAYASDLTLVNWPMVDYTDGPVHGGAPEEDAAHLAGAKRLGLAFLHWLQTEAPRPDGGAGWPGLRLEPEATGTLDGFAKAVYVRESRRIRARHTVTELEIGADAREGGPAERYADSVGIGAYRIDLHPSTGGDGYLDVAASPFQIPLGALLPVRLRNLLPAAKNLGTTHITNGCYRLHPVEWNVGEAAGRLAAHCAARRLEPAQVHADGTLLAEFQDVLRRTGVELEWPAEARAY